MADLSYAALTAEINDAPFSLCVFFSLLPLSPIVPSSARTGILFSFAFLCVVRKKSAPPSARFRPPDFLSNTALSPSASIPAIFIDLNVAGVRLESIPPVTALSYSPNRMPSRASLIATAADALPESIVQLTPLSPKKFAIRPLTMLLRSPGTVSSLFTWYFCLSAAESFSSIAASFTLSADDALIMLLNNGIRVRIILSSIFSPFIVPTMIAVLLPFCIFPAIPACSSACRVQSSAINCERSRDFTIVGGMRYFLPSITESSSTPARSFGSE